MAKPVPADEVNEQPVEGSYQVLKEQEVQEDKQAQRMAQQADKQTPDATLPPKS